MYQQPGAQPDPSAYSNLPQQYPTSLPPQQPPLPMAAYPNYAAMSQQQQSGAMNPAAGMYGQPPAQGWPGQPGANPAYAPPPNPYGAAPAPGGYPNPAAPSTAGLLQQQLAQQAAMAQQGSPAHQAYLQSQAQLLQARQQAQQPLPQQTLPSTPASQPSPFANANYAPTPSTSAAPAQPSPAYPQSRPPNQPQSLQELQNILRGVPLQGMTPERYNALQPAQQQALREYMVRQRAAQQAQLGLGMPGSPAATPSKPSPAAGTANGTPTAQTPRPTTAGAPPQGQANPMLKVLSEFYAKQGLPFPGPPTVEGRQLDLARMFGAVTQGGGFSGITTSRRWGHVATALGFPAPSPDQHPEQRLQALAQAYQTSLLPFEQSWAKQAAAHRNSSNAAASPASAGPNGSPANASPAQAPTPAGPPSSFVPPSQNLAAAPSPAGAASSPFATSIVPPAQSTPTPAVDLTASSVSSPFATGVTRPATATSQREGTAPPGTAGAGSMPPPSLGADVKGKGKAPEDDMTVVKAEPGLAVNGATASPAPLDSLTTPKTATSGLPDASAHSPARPATATKPTVPAEPARRKRRKIEYTPMVRPVETYGGVELPFVEARMVALEKMRRPRNLHDLGTVDVHSLTMSLRSRLPSEVSYALNALTLISHSMSIEPNDGGVPFPLGRCGDLADELVELLEETTFGPSGEEDGWTAPAKGKAKAKEPDEELPPFDPPTSYRELFRLVSDEAGALLPPRPDEPFEALPAAYLVLSVLNLLRNLALAPDNARLLGRNPHVLAVLARVAHLPLRQERRRDGERWPNHVSPADALSIKKDVVELLNFFASDIRFGERDGDGLTPVSSDTAQHITDLLLFFLRDTNERDQLYFDIHSATVLGNRHPQAPTLLIPPYLDLALSAFARISLLDANRAVLARLVSGDELYTLFEALVLSLPVAEADFQICTFEAGIVYMYHVALSLYNIAYVAPVEVKLRLRNEPRFVKSLVRVIRRLAGTVTTLNPDDMFLGLAERCISILQLLSSLGGISSASSAPATATADAAHKPKQAAGMTTAADLPWWGLSMSGDGDSDSDDADASESGSGGGGGGLLIKARLPPGEGAALSGAGGADAGPPILAGEARGLWELLGQGSMALVMGSLVGLTDATSGRKRKRKAEPDAGREKGAAGGVDGQAKA
ncbi:hypothetical protein JCM10207_003945 [Rhodosporidiobolus poonsookiae]